MNYIHILLESSNLTFRYPSQDAVGKTQEHLCMCVLIARFCA